MSTMRYWLIGAALALPAGAACASQINSGEADGAYHASFCPLLERELSKSGFNYKCTATNGTADNVARIARDPIQLGYGQLDIFALEVARHGGATRFTRLRVDDVRECLFAVTATRSITNYGAIAGAAASLRFVLPPANSGSAATFRFLQQIDPSGLGAARNVTHAVSTEEALRTALGSDNTVSLFVQFPDADNARFRLIAELGGHVVPVLDRNILRQQIEDRKIYFAQETEVANAGWLKSGTKVVTACTPLVLFTGANDRVGGDKARLDHKDLIATVVTTSKDELMPQEPLYKRLLRRTRELSASSVEKLTKVSDDAREKAKPWLDQAKDATGKAIEQAKPALDKAYERAKEDVKELLEEMRPKK